MIQHKSFEIILNFQQKTPLSEQIRHEIRQMIISALLQPGDPLPTVRELASQLHVNFNTVARAYRALDMEGWITTRQGRGTVVREPEQKERTQSVNLEDFLDTILSKAYQAGFSKEAVLEGLRSKIQLAQPSKKHLLQRGKSTRKISRKRVTTTYKPGSNASSSRISHHTSYPVNNKRKCSSGVFHVKHSQEADAAPTSAVIVHIQQETNEG